MSRHHESRSAPQIAVTIAFLMLLASFPASQVGAASLGQVTTGHPTLSARGTAVHPASMGLSAPLPGAQAPSSSSPSYDEQLGITFTQDQSALNYNVTALAQTDANGYGPAYILNGLTSLGYWYQVGISYHWPGANGGYEPGFAFSYQVFGPNGNPVYPSRGGSGLEAFSKVVNSGDSVLLSLTFSGPSVVMLAQDWNTGGTAKASYSSLGASRFVGDTSSPSNSAGFFTGLMTEWYHVLPYSGNEGKVTYTNTVSALSSAWMWIDEFDPSSSGQSVFINQTSSPVTFANAQQLYLFSSNGATMYGSAHRFITGQLNATASRVTLKPATSEADSPTFYASYTLGGLQQSSDVAAGTSTVVEADPGTSIMVSVNSSGSSGPERWVFAGTGSSAITSVNFAAGSNATYVYYDVVQEAVSYRVAGGGNPIPASSAPEVTYEVPPAVASAAVALVTQTQPIGTSPVMILAVAGSSASVNGTIVGGADHRWEANIQNWTVSAANSIPDTIEFYEQYQINVHYFVPPETPPTGPPPSGSGKPGALPLEPPEITSTFLGSQVTKPILANQTLFWFDAGSHYSWTPVINGSTPEERWIAQGNTTSVSTISASNTASDTVTLLIYVHQYYAALGVNNPDGGSISYKVVAPFEAGNSVGTGSAWIPAGSNLSASASSNAKWQFEGWSGSGAGAYTGNSPSINVSVMGPLTENATFYVQLAISASSGTNIVYSYGSETGAVQAGTTTTLYVPPSSTITLRATTSLFVYSFGSWQGAGLVNATKPSVVLFVDSPSAVTGTSSYNYPVILGAVVTAAVLILAASPLIRNRRKRNSDWAFPPT